MVAGASSAARICGSSLRVAIVGCGTVGMRAARQLLSVPGVDDIVLFDTEPAIAARLHTVIGRRSSVGAGTALDCSPAVIVLACPPGHVEMAEGALRAGVHVVSTGDAVPDAEGLLGLDDLARERNLHMVVGAGFAPGLTDVLARHAAAEFDTVDEIHVAKLGTAGPACARQHHSALSGEAVDWKDGAFIRRQGGSGRELCWFPDPIGGADCYRAALPDSIILHRSFGDATRITARVSATRRDRFTSWLPMMRRPHAEAGPGAVRVEIRGRRNGMAGVVVMACMDRPSVAAGAVAALAVGGVVDSTLLRTGAAGLAELVVPVGFLKDLATRGVKCARFEGTHER